MASAIPFDGSMLRPRYPGPIAAGTSGGAYDAQAFPAQHLPRPEMAGSVMEERRSDHEVFLDSLAAHCRRMWQRARDAKRATTSTGISVEQQIINEYRARNGEYNPDKLAALRQAPGSIVFMQVTGTKIRAATALIREVLNSGRPWDLEPTPNPELPPEYELAVGQQLALELMGYVERTGLVPTANELTLRQTSLRDEFTKGLREQAKQIATRMADEIEDRFVEGKFMRALGEAVDDMCTTKAGIVKGPIVRKKKAIKWGDRPGRIPEIRYEIRLDFERVNPLDMFPLPETRNFNGQGAGGFFHRHVMTRHALSDLIGQDGYDDQAIREVLRSHQDGHMEEWLYVDQQRAYIEQRPRGGYFSHEQVFDVLEYWDRVRGSLLNDWSRGRMQLDPEKSYDTHMWMVGNRVIYAKLNDHPLGIRPYSKFSYEQIPGAFWGRGIAELIRDIQEACNAVARALVNNVGIASGPQVAINDVDRLPPGTDVGKIFPWKVWKFTSDAMTTSHRPPIEFWQASLVANDLIKVFQFFDQLADAYTVPGHAHGDTSGLSGAGDTASGLSMLLGAASKMLKDALSHVDEGPLKETVERVFTWLMIYSDDESIKGDAKVKAKATLQMTQKEQIQVRRGEALASTNNPVDLQIMGLSGRGELLREVMKTLDMDETKIVADREELEAIDRLRGMFEAGPGGIVGQPMVMPGAPSQGRQVDGAGNVAGGAQEQRVSAQSQAA